MARAKNTQRAEARRRHREELRINTLSDDLSDPQDVAEEEAEVTPSRPTGLGMSFRRPNVVADVRAVPGVFRTKRTLWIPFALMVVAFAVYALWQVGVVPASATPIVVLMATIVLQPSALFMPFIAGFLAPRSSYVIGAILGLFQAILLTLLTFIPAPASATPPTGAATDATNLGSTGLGQLGAVYLVSIFFGAFAAGFASWYRGFLRSSQERAKANRMARDQQQKAKAKEDERKQRAAERDARRTAPRNTAP